MSYDYDRTATASNPVVEAELRGLLEQLRVNKGGRGTSASLRSDPQWTVRFYETTDRRNREKYPYGLSVDYKGKSRSIGLTPDKVFSRSRGTWKRDKVWRLTPEASTLFARQIVGLMERVTGSSGAQTEGGAVGIGEDPRYEIERIMGGMAALEPASVYLNPTGLRAIEGQGIYIWPHKAWLVEVSNFG